MRLLISTANGSTEEGIEVDQVEHQLGVGAKGIEEGIAKFVDWYRGYYGV